MFTVFIAAKEHTDAILRDNTLFFEPFLDNRELVFCQWNPQGQTLQEAVPGLLDAVGRRREWRAVILNQDQEAQLRKQNPFDVVEFSQLSAVPKPSVQPEAGENWDTWETAWKTYFETITPMREQIFREALTRPLQKLATWLCFRPSSFPMEETEQPGDLEDLTMAALEDDEIKPSVRLERLEQAQYRCELSMKETLRREFIQDKTIDIAYPAEVYCLSERITDSGFFHPGSFWSSRMKSEYSAFVDRNMLFDRMRFLVFDQLPPTHKNSRCDRIRFLYTALVFASNPIPGSALKARRLYALDSENDDTPLCTLVTSYVEKLSATYAVIDAEMERIRSEIPGDLSDQEAAALFCTPAEITVPMDESVHTELLSAELDYGLSGDCPTDEQSKWRQTYGAARKEMYELVRKRRRSARKSVEKLRISSQVPQANISRLTTFQLEDVREYTETAEDEMVAAIPASFSDAARYAADMEEQDRNVRKVLRGRMSRKTTILCGVVCLGIFLLCFLPMLWNNGATEAAKRAALLLIGSMVGLLAVVLVVTLFFLRSSVTEAVESFNSTTAAILQDITASMQALSNYLSAVCNVRRGYGVLHYFGKNIDEYTQKLRIRKKHQEDIKRKRAYLQEYYGDFIGGSTFCDEVMSCPYEYDFDQKVEYAYPAPFLAGDRRQIPFLESGNLIAVPSSYITRISVRLEELYDD